VILVSLIPLLCGVVNAGVITTVSGMVCEAVGLLAFRLGRQSNDRLDAINRDITLLTNTLLVTDLVGRISRLPVFSAQPARLRIIDPELTIETPGSWTAVMRALLAQAAD